MRRKELLVTGEVYHVFSKSIAGYKIFNAKKDYIRIQEMMKYFQIEGRPFKFSELARLKEVRSEGACQYLEKQEQRGKEIVQIVAYCIMPTHFHLLLKQLKDGGTSKYLGNILNSFTRYFNIKYKRKGPLWEGRFKNVRMESNDQLIHVTRYIHLNPVTAYLCKKPEDWQASSYKEYLKDVGLRRRLCAYDDLLEIDSKAYQKFVEDQIDYQRELDKIKHLLLD